MAVDNLTYVIPLLVLVGVAIWRWTTSSKFPRRHKIADAEDDEKQSLTDPYEDIEPLHDFDWATTEPIKIRPFKPKYHLTMALETCPLSELVANDNTYLSRMACRKSVLDAHPMQTHQCNAPCEPAVMEMYEWMFGTYLPRRYPTMYKLTHPPDSKTSSPVLHNIPADTYIPLNATSATQALYTLGHHVDTDILILLPSSTSPADGSPIYHLQAYFCCFPSGFKTHEKLGLPLAGIHKPVPGYKAKLEKSMDRFFAKMECGKAVRRVNWSITTDSKLYSQGGNHLYEGGKMVADHSAEGGETRGTGNEKTLDVEAPDIEESIEEQRKHVVVEDCRLRCERQTLHRLPKSKALVFMFKTYQYTMAEVKAEGSGEALADAIAGLPEGNVPDMAFYKRQVVWGERVVEFLRS